MTSRPGQGQPRLCLPGTDTTRAPQPSLVVDGSRMVMRESDAMAKHRSGAHQGRTGATGHHTRGSHQEQPRAGRTPQVLVITPIAESDFLVLALASPQSLSQICGQSAPRFSQPNSTQHSFNGFA